MMRARTLNDGGSSRVIVILCAGAVALAALVLLRPARNGGTGAAQAAAGRGALKAPGKVPLSQNTGRRRGPELVSQTAAWADPRVVQALAQEPSPETRQLVNSLVQVQLTNGVLSEEQAAEWQMNLGRLAGHGHAAIPAIREFLARNTDLEFGEAGKTSVGYATARLALLDVVAKAGGPEAVGALIDVLHVTGDPREIGSIARHLDDLDPGNHRQEALEAARQTLDMANQGNLADRDVAPLFEVFQKYGDASQATELSRNAQQWSYYSAIALAQLPEGAGIPTLVEIVNADGELSSSARVPALAMLAQAAPESELARSALVEQARQNKLSGYNWATLQAVLSGDVIRFQESVFEAGLAVNDQPSTHINAGNQNFYTAPPATGFTPEQIQSRAALIDELMRVTTDPAGQQVLQQAKTDLEQRLPPIASTQGPTP